MNLAKRLGIQANILTELFLRLNPFLEDRFVYLPNEEMPELWVPARLLELYKKSGRLVAKVSIDEELQFLPAGKFVSMPIARAFWSTVIPFVIQTSERKLMVLDNGNTMVYIPKCKKMIDTGLCDGSVIRSITNNEGRVYTACPSESCNYPGCINASIITQPSIKAAKVAFRSENAVVLTRGREKMLFCTNGANHLNLVTVGQAIENAWFSDWLVNLRSLLIDFYGENWSEKVENPQPEKIRVDGQLVENPAFDSTWNAAERLEERLSILQGEEMQRFSEAERLYPKGNTDFFLEDIELPENIRIKKK